MGMTGAGQVFAAGTERHRHRSFIDQIACVRAKNMHPQQTVGLGVGKDFDKAIELAEGAGATVGAERK